MIKYTYKHMTKVHFVKCNKEKSWVREGWPEALFPGLAAEVGKAALRRVLGVET